MNGKPIRWDRIAAAVSIFVLLIAGIISYSRVTSSLNSDLDRNCRILVRIDNAQNFLVLQRIQSQQAAQNFLNANQTSPQEICG